MEFAQMVRTRHMVRRVVAVRDQEALRSLPGIPDHVSPVGVALIGHDAPNMRSQSLLRGRRALDDVVHRERW